MKLRQILILIFLISCTNHQIKFDQQKWQVELDGFYDYREAMVDDLIKNHLSKGMKTDEVIQLLGQPNLQHQNQFSYFIMEDYGRNIDPIESKSLILLFSKDSILKEIKLLHNK